AERLFLPAGRVMPAGFDRQTGRRLFQRDLSWRLTGLFGGTHVQVAGDLVFTGVEQVVAMFEGNGSLALTELLPASKPSTGHQRLVVAKDALYVLTGKELIGATRDGWLSVYTHVTQRTLRMDSLGRQRSRLARERQVLEQERQAAKTKTGTLPPETAESQRLGEQVKDLDKQIAALRAERAEWWNKRDEPVRWRTPFEGSDELILAGSTLLAGGPDAVAAFDAQSGRQVWSAKVHGRARSLAVAGGRLIVSTDKGRIHCFVPGETGKGAEVAPEVAAEPFGKDERARYYAAEAERIVKATGVKRGYALILGESTGRLAHALARRTELMIYVVAADAKEIAAARKALSAAGVYGAKVVVMSSPGGELPFSDYFANLIVCGPEMALAKEMPSPADVYRMLKPCGGVLTVTPPEDILAGAAAAKLGAWRKELAGLTGRREAVGAKGIEVARGPLAGAGSWTHQYGEPGNTCAGDDQLVRGALGILWYGEPGPGRMPNRHASAAAPLAFGGRMFVQGENVVMAYDAYNGVELWQREVPGAMRLGLKTRASNFAADGNSLLLAVADRCLRLDAATGETLATWKVPPDKQGKSGNWEYVAAADGLVLGCRANQCVFAIDPATGKLRWAHEGGNIEPRTICLGGGRVYFVDKSASAEQRAEVLKGVQPSERLDRRGKPIPPDVRLLVALNAGTGKVEWSRPQYVSDCVKVGSAGGDLIVMYANNVLLLCGQPWNGHFWREFMAGEFSRRSLIALAAYSGETIWSGRKGYRSRPLIVGDRIIAEPWAYDLQTGTACVRTSPLTGARSAWQMSRPGHHCGNIAGAPNALFFRSGVLAYYDLLADQGTAHFSGQRPGCWVNCIPANGLVMMPEAASGCICPFPLQTTVVFQPGKARRRTWGMYSTPEPLIGAKKLAINFGAPGDRKASDGTLWLAWPRPRSYEKDYDQRLVMNFDLDVSAGSAKEKVTFPRLNADFLTVEGTGDPWIYAFACEGLTKLTLPLQAQRAKPAKYTVRLHFAEAP
ncbi:MAG TPA: PQQ-binding-like beta-propeller repeat protein, partial [Phycisphaerae bacterium]|nr:PQQ-binding-like beta-propeller repeat protein [Phycisphaerae bacterium]